MLQINSNLMHLNPRNDIEYDLDYHIYKLLHKEPFFARVSRRLRKVAVYSIPTAGVRLNEDSFSYELAYNPKFFSSLTEEQRLWVLMHEMYHIALGHVSERSHEQEDKKLENIAMDEAINSLPNMIKGAPEFAVVPGRAPPKEASPNSIAYIVKDHLPEQSFEWYLKLLKKQDESQSGNLDGDSFDDHSGWSGDNIGKAEIIKQIANEKIKDIVQKAAKESDEASIRDSDSGWGSVSREIRKLISASFERKLDAKQVLAHFVKTSVRAEKKHRITKINRRWPYIHPGRAWDRRAKIAISIDQSGSVDDSMLAKFFGWLNDLSKFADFTVIPFDDQVFEQKIYVWKKGERRARERVLSGGTNFDAPTKYVNEHSFDGHIIMTDMYAQKPGPSRCQRMWITDRNCARHPYFSTNERILVVD